MANVAAFEYRPLPRFEAFHRSEAYEASMFGGYGSGKSVALCAEAWAFGFEQPGAEILVLRKTVPALRDTTEQTFQNLAPPEFWDQCDVRRAGGHLESVTTPLGTKYMFRGCDDWTKHKSMNLAGMFFDEADEFSPEDYEGLMSRMRQTRPTAMARALGYQRISRQIIRSASNPAGKNWLWKRFVSPEHRMKDSGYFVSTSLDNPYLPIRYINSLLDMPEPWVRRYVLCSFDEFAGQIYEDWMWETHVIDPLHPDDIDPSGLFLMGMDPGTRDPTAALWAYYDKKKHRVIGLAEYQQHSLSVHKHVSEWRKIEARYGIKVSPSNRVADPQAINVRDRGTQMTLHDQYRKLGYSFQLGPSKHSDRIPSLGQLIFLRRFVVTKDCPLTYEQIKEYRWKDLTPSQRARGEDAPETPLKKNSHLVDCAQYIASRRMAPPKIDATSGEDDRPVNETDAEIREAIRKKVMNQRPGARPRNHDLGGISV
jgi:PBSX family phage terminase large subunit